MKKYLKWVVLLLVCVGIAVSLSNTVSHYSAISTVLKNVTINSSIAIRKIDRLENSAEALSEWYIELKKEIVDLRNEVLKSNAESTKFKGLIMQNRREVTKSKYPSY